MERNNSSSASLDIWLQKLESLDVSHIDLGLERVAKVAASMELNHSAKIITVAGTNGKGSTAALIEHFLSANKTDQEPDRGFTVGVFSSPHLFHFRERIRIRGRLATDEELVLAFEKVEAARKETTLTYFEVATLAAAFLFSREKLDFWVLEVGLGGRLDAVNVFEPDVALVTNIGLDHMNWLGDTVEQIAYEKAGIFRHEKPAIYASSARPKAIDETIDRVGAIPYFADTDFGIRQKNGRFEFWCEDLSIKGVNQSCAYTIPAFGDIFVDNLQGALMVMQSLDILPTQAALEGLEDFSLAGRFSRFSWHSSNIIVDVAHNADSVELLANRLAKLQLSSVTCVIGYMADKDASALISPIKHFADKWVIVEPSISRSASLRDVALALKKEGVHSSNIVECETFDLLPELIAEDTNVIIYGSFYTVSESVQALGVVIG